MNIERENFLKFFYGKQLITKSEKPNHFNPIQSHRIFVKSIINKRYVVIIPLKKRRRYFQKHKTISLKTKIT